MCSYFFTANWHLRAHQLVKRQYLYFHVMLIIFVVICSFLYGLTAGLGKNIASAAKLFAREGFVQTEVALEEFPDFMPQGVFPVSLGSSLKVNGRDAKIAAFVSERKVKELLSEQIKNWETAGFFTFGVGSSRRGIAFAVDLANQQRYVLSVWVVPRVMRAVVTGGMRVQGVLSAAKLVEPKGRGEALSLETVPDVPLIAGGRSGVVLTSIEAGILNHTGVYTNPGSLQENLDFYRSELAAAGWQETKAPFFSKEELKFSHFNCAKGDEEIQLLLAPIPVDRRGKPSETVETLVFVNRGVKS